MARSLNSGSWQHCDSLTCRTGEVCHDYALQRGVDIVTPGTFVAVGKGIVVQRITDAVVICIRIEVIEPHGMLIRIAHAVVVVVRISSIGIAVPVSVNGERVEVEADVPG